MATVAERPMEKNLRLRSILSGALVPDELIDWLMVKENGPHCASPADFHGLVVQLPEVPVEVDIMKSIVIKDWISPPLQETSFRAKVIRGFHVWSPQ